MKFYSFGNGIEYHEYDISGRIPNALWGVYWYQEGNYCGDGNLTVFDGQDLWDADLSHCSCNGPFDELDFTKVSSGKEYLQTHSRSIFDENHTNEVRDKIIELLMTHYGDSIEVSISGKE